jgi:toluene monooxygenase system protein B
LQRQPDRPVIQRTIYLEREMALFPISSAFEGDFCLKLVPVDTENTMDEVCAAAAHHSLNRSVAPRPGHRIRVRKQGDLTFLPRDMKLMDAGIAPMQCLQFMFEREES